MMVLDNHVYRRRAIHQLYKKELEGIAGISVFDNPSSDFNFNHWLTCIVVDPAIAGSSREDIRLKMDEANIETRPLWKPMHMQPVFEGTPFYGDGTSEALFDKGLCLPSGSSLTNDDIMRVIEVITSF
jgi:dTDP-4-amino-4,6-dideoxygalactose transaminase